MVCAASGLGAWIAWMRRESGDWDIFRSWYNCNGRWSDPQRVGWLSGPDINPAVAFTRIGGMMLAWQHLDSRDWNIDTQVVDVGVAEQQPLPMTGLAIAPNPSHGLCRLVLSGTRSPATSIPLSLSVVDFSGRTLLQSDFHTLPSDFVLDLRRLPTGIYFCRLSSGSTVLRQPLLLVR